MRVILSEQEIKKRVLLCTKYMIEHDASIYETSKHFSIPKTTLQRQIYQYLPGLDLELYDAFIKVINKKDKKTIEKQEEINKRTLALAHFMIEEERAKTLPFSKALEFFPYKLSRKEAEKNIYTRLKKLDATEDKSLYLAVLRKIANDSLPHQHRAKNAIHEVEEELREKYKNIDIDYQDTSLERRILKITNHLLSNSKSIDDICSEYNIEHQELVITLQEILPTIDYHLYLKLCKKMKWKAPECVKLIIEEESTGKAR